MTRIYVASAAAILAALAGGLWLATIVNAPDDRFAACRETPIGAGSDQIGAGFELIDAKGETVTDKEVLSEPSLIYFGYTYCPDECPVDAARNAGAADILQQRGQTLTPVFISIDPERDTPRAVGEFAANMHERMIGLTGSPEQVKAASDAYRTYYKAQSGDDGDYLVEHSAISYLVLPEHGFVEFFRRDVGVEDLADRIGCFLDKA